MKNVVLNTCQRCPDLQFIYRISDVKDRLFQDWHQQESHFTENSHPNWNRGSNCNRNTCQNNCHMIYFYHNIWAFFKVHRLTHEYPQNQTVRSSWKAHRHTHTQGLKWHFKVCSFSPGQDDTDYCRAPGSPPAPHAPKTQSASECPAALSSAGSGHFGHDGTW